MKWKAELFIFSRDYDFVEKKPDAFVESESKLEACNMIMQYVLTMINKDDALAYYEHVRQVWQKNKGKIR